MTAHELFQRCGLSRRLVDDFLKPTLLVGLFKPPEDNGVKNGEREHEVEKTLEIFAPCPSWKRNSVGNFPSYPLVN